MHACSHSKGRRLVDYQRRAALSLSELTHPSCYPGVIPTVVLYCQYDIDACKILADPTSVEQPSAAVHASPI